MSLFGKHDQSTSLVSYKGQDFNHLTHIYKLQGYNNFTQKLTKG